MILLFNICRVQLCKDYNFTLSLLHTSQPNPGQNELSARRKTHSLISQQTWDLEPCRSAIQLSASLKFPCNGKIRPCSRFSKLHGLTETTQLKTFLKKATYTAAQLSNTFSEDHPKDVFWILPSTNVSRWFSD